MGKASLMAHEKTEFVQAAEDRMLAGRTVHVPAWDDPTAPWKLHMVKAFEEMLAGPIGSNLNKEHTAKTPNRAVEAYVEMFKGIYMDPEKPLRQALFSSTVDQMITVHSVTIRSVCGHHCLPIVGHATLSYIPAGWEVGLSKIPRFIDILAKRPQVQEHLTQQIVDTFQEVVQPRGCAVMIRAYHFCMMMRGPEEHQAYTETTALKGVMCNPSPKAEFLQAAQNTPVWGK